MDKKSYKVGEILNGLECDQLDLLTDMNVSNIYADNRFYKTMKHLFINSKKDEIEKLREKIKVIETHITIIEQLVSKVKTYVESENYKANKKNNRLI